ncbi:MAG: hypothetical protein M1838_001674 [Thelocarpon superellum]|nr:MAG: hypothetical protein M1838_001674 [Thelocarpon superellum]
MALLHPTVFGGPLERPWSRRYLELTASGCPMLMQALDPQNLPLMPMATMSAPVKWGVVKIINLPFTITKNEIYVFLGRHARVIEGPAISILMNRATAKTMETYVEFEMPSDAKHFVERYNDPKNKKRRRPSIGDRPVVMEVSSQEAFMAKLFPKAHCVSWTGQEPVVHPPADPSTAGFRGFLTKEEIVMTVKHAETPQRSPYVDKCPQRPYESFVSTLVKFPWWEDTLITLELRDQMFWAAERLTTILMNQMRKGVPGLEQGLLFELVGAVVKTPGFSEAQKYRVCVSAGMSGREFGLAPYAHAWPFATLTKKEETEPDVLKLYAALIREATVPFADQGNPEKDWSPFGNFVVPWPANAAQMTLREASILELNTFEYYLRQVLPQ